MSVYIIAAACENMGIGQRGQLPWRLKKEMAFFKEKTMATQSPDKQNAVIMGRKTWLSIPEKIRPLSGRLNVVLTTTQLDLNGPAHVTDSFEKAMAWLQTPSIKEKIDKIFIVGGEAVYKIAMDSDYHQVIFLTRILHNYDCDAFFPRVDPEKYSLTECQDVPQGIQEENGIKYKYEVYVKKQNCEENLSTE